MKNIKNKKKNAGFTLVELLAVIVVLALVMTLAFSSILGSGEKAKKKTFNLEAQKILNATQENIRAEEALSKTGLELAGCYSLEAVMGSNPNGYTGSVLVEYTTEYTYTLWLHNSDYQYAGKTQTIIYDSSLPNLDKLSAESNKDSLYTHCGNATTYSTLKTFS